MNREIKIGDRIHHMKHGETVCARYSRNGKNQDIIVGKNGVYAPIYEWIKLAPKVVAENVK